MESNQVILLELKIAAIPIRTSQGGACVDAKMEKATRCHSDAVQLFSRILLLQGLQ
jgi:hypothetical protein